MLPIEKAAGAGITHHLPGTRKCGSGVLSESDARRGCFMPHRFVSRVPRHSTAWPGQEQLHCISGERLHVAGTIR